MKNIAILSVLLFTATTSIGQACDNVEFVVKREVVLPRCNGNDGEINFELAQGYTYILDTISSETGEFDSLALGNYEIIVINPNRCRDTVNVRLSYRDITTLIRPQNAFTPNGDNLNDTWVIPGIESFKGSEVRVFNRWGQQVHVNTSYSNTVGWDGTQLSSDLPAATYYYIISVVNNCVEEYINGTVTIIR